MGSEEFETNVKNYFEPEKESDPSLKVKSLQAIRQLFASPYSIEWTISIFGEFKKDLTKTVVFKNISHWCRNNWEEIDEEMYPQIKYMLFEYSLQNYSSFTEKAQKELAIAQVLYSFRAYTIDWPDFFSFLLGDPTKSYVMKYIREFFYEFAFVSPCLYQYIQEIRARMESESVFSSLFDHIMNGVTLLDPSAFEALSYYSKSVSYEWALDSGNLQFIHQGLSNSKTTAVSLSIIEVLLRSNLLLDIKSDILNQLDLFNFLSTPINDSIILPKIGSILYSISVLLDGDNLDGVFTTSAEYFALEDNQLIDNICSLFFSVVIKNGEYSNKVLVLCLEKLVQIYSQSVPVDEQQIEKILRPIRVCFLINRKSSTDTLVTAVSDVDMLQYHQVGAAVIRIVYDLCAKGITDEALINLLTNSFLALIDSNLEIPTELYYLYILVLRMPLVLTRHSSFNKDFLYVFLTNSINLCSNPNCLEPFKSQASQIMTQLAMIYSKFGNINTDLFSVLLQFLSIDSIATAAILVYGVSEAEQLSIIEAVFNHLFGLISTSDNPKHIISMIFVFFQKLIITDQSLISNYVSFVDNVLESYSFDDKLMGDLLLSLPPLMFYGFAPFVRVTNHLFENFIQTNAISNSASVANKFLSMATDKKSQSSQHPHIEEVQDLSWIAPFTDRLLLAFEGQLDIIMKVPFVLNDVTDVITMIRSVLSYLSNNIIVLKEEFFGRISEIVQKLLLRYYDNHYILHCVYSYLFSLTNRVIITHDLNRPFYSPSMNFIFSSSFDINNTKWENLLLKILINLHANWSKDYSTFSMEITNVFTNKLGFTEDQPNTYLQILENDKTTIWKPLHELLESIQSQKSPNICATS